MRKAFPRLPQLKSLLSTFRPHASHGIPSAMTSSPFLAPAFVPAAFAPPSAALLTRSAFLRPAHPSRLASSAAARAASALPVLPALRAPAAAAPTMVVATEMPALTKREVGEVVSGFKLAREEYIPDVSSTARLWVHEKTGTELLSLTAADENKTFGAVLRTTPSDSSGVPHILEHSVLCGSRKYPCKEPFVELIKSSLNTFLNAMTYPDKTCYPVASCNLQDFYNLVDVYMDAVFHPRLTPDTLRQEGHHFEVDDVDGPVTIKGVVYNEMKGAYSDPERCLGEHSMRSLFPDTTYGVESGGHPRNIPDLTWEQFEGFHKTYYHPSNARLWFYGDDAEEMRLAKADEFLSEFERSDEAAALSKVPLQEPWSEPRDFEFGYDAGADGDISKKYMATLNWMLPPIDQVTPTELLAYGVLGHVLLSNSGSPLYKALIDSQIGEDLVGSGLETDLRQMLFSVGLKGMAEDGADKMKALVIEFFENVVSSGLPKEVVESSLNTIEFGLRENNTGRFPKGLSLMLRAMSTWLHDADPLVGLKFEEPLRDLKERLASGETIFEDLIKTQILENTHCSFVRLVPDKEFAAKEESAEKARIDSAMKGLSVSEKKELVEMTQRLKEKQAAPDSPEALASVPCLTKADLPLKSKTVPFDAIVVGSSTLVHHPQPTNGVVYLDMAFDFRNLPARILPLVSLFSSCLSELGTNKEDFVSLQQRVGRDTGGIRASDSIGQNYDVLGRGRTTADIWIRSKAMAAQVPQLLGIIRDMVTEVKWDNKERFMQLVTEEKAAVESSIAPSGHQYAMARLASKFRSSGWANEQCGGLSYLFFLRELTKRVESDWDSVLADLKTIQKLVLSSAGLKMNVTTGSDDYRTVGPLVKQFIADLPAGSLFGFERWVEENPAYSVTNEGIIVPTQVNYVGKAANLLDLGYKPNGASLLAVKHLGTSYLWDTIRVQGGAYGAFSRLDNINGNFTFLSYRDPSVNKTIDAFDKTSEFLRNIELTEEELTKATIGMIGEMDSYSLPDSKGFNSFQRFLINYTDEDRQRVRDEVLSAGVAEFRKLGEALAEVKDKGSVVVVGSEESLKKAKEGGLDMTFQRVF